MSKKELKVGWAEIEALEVPKGKPQHMEIGKKYVVGLENAKTLEKAKLAKILNKNTGGK